MLEKALERKACKLIKELGGLALKCSPTSSVGYPDRIILLNDGQLFFVEFKKQGLKPTKLQNLRALALRERGYSVYFCDSLDEFHNILGHEGVQ